MGLTGAHRPRGRRWRPRYSLRSLLLFVAVASAGMAWVAFKIRQARRQSEAVQAIRKLGGVVLYDWQMRPGPGPLKPSGPAWLRRVLGDDFFSDVIIVHLNGTEVTDSDLKLLDAFPQLHFLWLDDTSVDDDGLGQLRCLDQLEFLSLRGTHVTDRGLEWLSGASSLRVLELGHTEITDAGLQHLTRCASLEMLEILGTDVTDEGVTRLRRTLPGCGVFWWPPTPSEAKPNRSAAVRSSGRPR